MCCNMCCSRACLHDPASRSPAYRSRLALECAALLGKHPGHWRQLGFLPCRWFHGDLPGVTQGKTGGGVLPSSTSSPCIVKAIPYAKSTTALFLACWFHAGSMPAEGAPSRPPGRKNTHVLADLAQRNVIGYHPDVRRGPSRVPQVLCGVRGENPPGCILRLGHAEQLVRVTNGSATTPISPSGAESQRCP